MSRLSFRTEFEKLNDTKEWTTVFTDETMDDFMVIRRELSGLRFMHVVVTFQHYAVACICCGYTRMLDVSDYVKNHFDGQRETFLKKGWDGSARDFFVQITHAELTNIVLPQPGISCDQDHRQRFGSIGMYVCSKSNLESSHCIGLPNLCARKTFREWILPKRNLQQVTSAATFRVYSWLFWACESVFASPAIDESCFGT